MDELSDLLGGITEGVEVVLLFTPGGSTYERFAASRFDIVVAAPTNSHDADRFVRLPVQFNELRDRFRFGIEGAIQNARRSSVQPGCTVTISIRSRGSGRRASSGPVSTTSSWTLVRNRGSFETCST